MKITGVKYQYPAYMKFFYDDIYGTDNNYKHHDNIILCYFRTLFQYGRLVKELNSEISSGKDVCQIGAVLGNQIQKTAATIGSLGVYDIIDISPIALQQVKKKLNRRYPQINFIKEDAAFTKVKAVRDVVICFMLLSMVPPFHRKRIINNALGMLKPGGKAIFIDWHKPKRWNLLAWPLKLYNRLYNPFVEDLQKNTIKFLSENQNVKGYIWKQKSFFGGLFQKTIVVRRKRSENI